MEQGCLVSVVQSILFNKPYDKNNNFLNKMKMYSKKQNKVPFVGQQNCLELH